MLPTIVVSQNRCSAPPKKEYVLPQIDSLARTEEKFSAEINEVGLLEDPVKRIFALQKIKNDIHDQQRNVTEGIYERARDSGVAIGSPGVLASFAVPFILGSTLASGPLGALAMIGLSLACMSVGLIVGGNRMKSVMKKLTPKYADHMKKLESFQSRTSNLMDAEVKNNAKAIQKLPLNVYDKLMELPGLVEKFKAAIKGHKNVPPAGSSLSKAYKAPNLTA